MSEDTAVAIAIARLEEVVKGVEKSLSMQIAAQSRELMVEIHAGDSSAMQAVRFVEKGVNDNTEAIKGYGARLTSLEQGKANQRDLIGINEKLGSLDTSRAKVYGAMGTLSFLFGASGIFIGHFWK